MDLWERLGVRVTYPEAHAVFHKYNCAAGGSMAYSVFEKAFTDRRANRVRDCDFIVGGFGPWSVKL